MEQKQLDEMEDSQLTEEFIDETDFVEEEVKIEPAKAKTSVKKTKTAKKAAPKKVEKKVEKTAVQEATPKVVEEKVKASSPPKETPKIVEQKPEPTKNTNPWDDSTTTSSGGFWKALTIILLILFVVSLFTHGFQGGNNEVSLDEAETMALEYVNTVLLQPPNVATVQNSQELENVYQVTLEIQDETVDAYITKDGSLFFPQGLPLIVSGEDPDMEIPIVNGEAPTVDDDPMLGNAGAPVTIIEFSDFECPFCKEFVEETLPQLKSEYIDTGKVKLVFRDFPLTEIHPQAEAAALAAECAADQGKYWDYHDYLFAHQGELSDENYILWAEELGLDEEAFALCYDNEIHAAEIAADREDGEAAGVTGTPAFFINGKFVSGAQPFATFATEIDSLLTEEQEINQPPIRETPTGETKELSLTAKRWIFTPTQLIVNKDSHVVLNINPQDLQFTFSLPSFGVEEEINGPTVVEFTADKVGEFTFSCGSCEDWRGMSGQLIVR